MPFVLFGCQAAAPALKAGAPASDSASSAGKQLFVSRGCVACHRAPGVPEAQGTIGPNLRGIGDPAAHPTIAGVLANTPENMQRWLLNPPAVKPGTTMPSVGLSETEAAELAAFLTTLK